jgi:hypothetical protein
MRSVPRALGTLLAAVATFYFVFWLPFSLILPAGRFTWIRILGSLLCALLVARYIWGHSTSTPRGLFSSVVRGALVTGVLGFAAGFFGPIIFAPSANQGPLLGIFITGPLGVLLGAVGGGIYWLTRGNRAAKPPGE